MNNRMRFKQINDKKSTVIFLCFRLHISTLQRWRFMVTNRAETNDFLFLLSDFFIISICCSDTREKIRLQRRQSRIGAVKLDPHRTEIANAVFAVSSTFTIIKKVCTHSLAHSQCLLPFSIPYTLYMYLHFLTRTFD